MCPNLWSGQVSNGNNSIFPENCKRSYSSSVGIAFEFCWVCSVSVDVKIGDSSRKSIELEEIGEISVQGDLVILGFWREPDASEKALTQGWLHTEETGSMDNEGYFTLKDCSKDLIILGSSTVNPREVEDILLLHPNISEAAVVGQDHSDWGKKSLLLSFYQAKRRFLQKIQMIFASSYCSFKAAKKVYFC